MLNIRKPPENQSTTPCPTKELEAQRDILLTGFRLLRCGDIGQETLEELRASFIDAASHSIAAWVAENYEDPAESTPWDEGDYVYIYGSADTWDVVNEIVGEFFEEIDPEYKLCSELTDETLTLLSCPAGGYGGPSDEGYGIGDVCVPLFGRDEPEDDPEDYDPEPEYDGDPDHAGA